MDKQLNFEDFVVLHQEQFISSSIPERCWYTLYEKIRDEVFDAGDIFMIQKVVLDSDDEDSSSSQDGEMETNQKSTQNSEKFKWQVVVHAEDGISSTDEKQVYLIDHAWTYRLRQSKQQLSEVPELLNRMVTLMDINNKGKSGSQLVDEVFNEMWKFNLTYSIGNANFGSEESMPIWYIMDEFGIRIQHADQPSVKVVPFCFIPTQVSYSVLFLLQDLEYGDEVTRDYVEGCRNDMQRRKMRLLPWFPGDYTHLSYDQKELSKEFTKAYTMDSSLPNLDVDFPPLPTDRKIRIFTDIDLIYDHFQRDDEQLEMVDDEAIADVIWTSKHILDYKGYSEERTGCILSQFPYETVLTVKDLMSATARISWSGTCNPDTLETTPAWLQTTYNLETELAEFVSYFQQREARGLDNVWICKPWNLGRGLDINVTDNLNYIVRMPDTGPKVACKYITDPVLLELDDVGAVKYDIRYLVLLCSVKPLKLMVHHTFCSRVANKAFSLDNFDDVEKHLSVLAYKGVDIITVLPEDFIKKFEAQNPGFKFADVQDHMFRCIKDLFIAVTTKEPPFGLGHSPQSRSMYGIDFMLKWVTNEKGEKQIQPVINECNFVPDFTRHQWFRKEFVNDIFHAMLLDDIKDRPVSVL